MAFQSLIQPHLQHICLLGNLLFTLHSYATHANFTLYDLLLLILCLLLKLLSGACRQCPIQQLPFAVDTEQNHSAPFVNEELLLLSLTSFLRGKDPSLASCRLQLIASGSSSSNS